jgi:hypothetical protein
MGPILLFISLFLLFIIVGKITFVNHFAEFVGNIYFYCFLLLTVYLDPGGAGEPGHELPVGLTDQFEDRGRRLPNNIPCVK